MLCIEQMQKKREDWACKGQKQNLDFQNKQLEGGAEAQRSEPDQRPFP